MPETAIGTGGPGWLSDLLTSDHRRGFYISGKHFALQHTERSKSILYVGFDNLGSVRDRRIRNPWGYEFAAKSGWSYLGIMTFAARWFRHPELFTEMERLSNDGFFSRFDKVIFSGTSMGAYGACAFSSLALGCTVIAFSPQSSLRPDIASWDNRYPFSRADWSGPYADAAEQIHAASKVWVIYDPFDPLDARHAARLTGPNVTHLRARRSSHFCALTLSKIGMLSGFVQGCVAGTMTHNQFYAEYRRARESKVWLGHLVEQASAKASDALKLRLADALRRRQAPRLAKRLRNQVA